MGNGFRRGDSPEPKKTDQQTQEERGRNVLQDSVKEHQGSTQPAPGDVPSASRNDGSDDAMSKPTGASQERRDDITRFRRDYTPTGTDQTAPETSKLGFLPEARALMAKLGNDWFPQLSDYEFKSVELVPDKMVKEYDQALKVWVDKKGQIDVLARIGNGRNYNGILDSAELIKEMHAAAGTLMLGDLIKARDLHTKSLVERVADNTRRYRALRERLGMDLYNSEYRATYGITEIWNLAIEQFRQKHPSAHSGDHQEALQQSWHSTHWKSADDPGLKSRRDTLNNTINELSTALRRSDHRVISQRLDDAIEAWDQATREVT